LQHLRVAVDRRVAATADRLDQTGLLVGQVSVEDTGKEVGDLAVGLVDERDPDAGGRCLGDVEAFSMRCSSRHFLMVGFSVLLSGDQW
jgi:hypothetical protein